MPPSASLVGGPEDPALLEGGSGRYRILRRLSVGGAAEIFLAENLAAVLPHQRHVVAKQLRAAGGELSRSLVDEARLIARLDHPNIARALDLAEGAHGLCLILECLHGEDVHEILCEVRRTSQRFPYGIAARIAADVAAGLHHAHQRAAGDGTPLAVVHRDVTPDNVLVTYAGDVKLLDFGIAKWIGATEQTQLGFVKGKAPYLSPEQCMQSTIDRRSDVFSMGTLLYQMTTLRTPFGDVLGEDNAIMQRIVDGRYPAPERIVADYPAELAEVVARCLMPARELRYADAHELRRDLLALISRRGWAASSDDLARYLRGLFGERSPPWLDDPPTRIAALVPPGEAPPVEEEATVIGAPPAPLLALAGGEVPPERAYSVGDSTRVNVRAVLPGDETTTVTDWPPPPPCQPRMVTARIEARGDRGWRPVPVAIAFAVTAFLALGLAARCFG